VEQISLGISELRGVKSSTGGFRPVSAMEKSGLQHKTSPRKPLLTILVLLMCSVHLLLPIERGFPTIKIVGYPLTLPIIITFFSAVMLFFSLKGNGFFILNKYILSQMFVVVTLFVSAFLSDDIEAGLFVVLNYFTTFVLGFWVVCGFLKLGLRRQVVVVLCCVASLAAIIGIFEGLFHFYLPFYKQLFLQYQYNEFLYAMTRPDFRVFGTLGNPLTYPIALMLCVPFVFEINRPFLRCLVLVLLFGASWLAVSTTTLILWGVLLVGVFVISRRKGRLVLGLAILMVGMVLLSPYWMPKLASFIDTWTAEFDFANLQNPQFVNIKIRYDLFLWAIRSYFDGDFVSLFFGYGLKSSGGAVSKLGIGRMNTLDNVYATLLFECGLAGLGSFLLMEWGILVGSWKSAKYSLYWYAILGFAIVGLSFTTIFYSTFNFIWVASVAMLIFDLGSRQQSGYMKNETVELQ